MGQYKLDIKFVWGIGGYLKYEQGYHISFYIPFICFYFGLTDHASGVRIFGKNLEE
jgi:hypothetical protein